MPGFFTKLYEVFTARAAKEAYKYAYKKPQAGANAPAQLLKEN